MLLLVISSQRRHVISWKTLVLLCNLAPSIVPSLCTKSHILMYLWINSWALITSCQDIWFMFLVLWRVILALMSKLNHPIIFVHIFQFGASCCVGCGASLEGTGFLKTEARTSFGTLWEMVLGGCQKYSKRIQTPVSKFYIDSNVNHLEKIRCPHVAYTCYTANYFSVLGNNRNNIVMPHS